MNRCFKPCLHAPFKVSSSDQVVSPDYSFLIGSKRQPWYRRFLFWFRHLLKRFFYELQSFRENHQDSPGMSDYLAGRP